MLICEICRFPAPGKGGNRDNHFRENVMGWIEQQATEAWAPEESEVKAEAAVDFLTVFIKPVPAPVPSHLDTGKSEPRTQWPQVTQPTSTATAGQSSGQTSWHRRHMDEPSTSSNEKVPLKRQRTERGGV